MGIFNIYREKFVLNSKTIIIIINLDDGLILNFMSSKKPNKKKAIDKSK